MISVSSLFLTLYAMTLSPDQDLNFEARKVGNREMRGCERKIP